MQPTLRRVLVTPEVRRLVKAFNAHVGSVEVVRNGELQSLLFRVPDIVLRESSTPAFK